MYIIDASQDDDDDNEAPIRGERRSWDRRRLQSSVERACKTMMTISKPRPIMLRFSGPAGSATPLLQRPQRPANAQASGAARFCHFYDEATAAVTAAQQR